jgi:hypothetical protein
MAYVPYRPDQLSAARFKHRYEYDKHKMRVFRETHCKGISRSLIIYINNSVIFNLLGAKNISTL